MAKVSEEVWKRIQKNIKHRSQTAEYLVQWEFQKLSYFADTYYYVDYDREKGTDVVRELDFSAFKSLEEYREAKILRIRTISFLGDVKYHVGYGERIVFGLKLYKDPSEAKMPERLDTWQLMKSIASIFSEDVLDVILWKEFFTELSTLLPICRHVIFFDKKGEETQEPDNAKFRRWCQKINSGFYAEKLRKGKIPSNNIQSQSTLDFKEVHIPLLVFGNKIQFLVCHPEELTTTQPEQPSALLYLFQSSMKSPEPSTYLTPIIITSLQKLPHVVTKIEQAVFRQYQR